MKEQVVLVINFIINGGSGNDGGIILQRENANQWQINNVTGNDNDLSFYSYGSSSYPFTLDRSTEMFL